MGFFWLTFHLPMLLMAWSNLFNLLKIAFRP